MNRKDFFKKSVLGALGIAAGTKISKSETNAKDSTYDKLMDQVGFNHLPNNEIQTMKSVLHKANTRGAANHGWLQSNHSFSFANYRNPERMNFGVLRVLNDDVVAPGMGFGTHPHDNMEIISIPLEGDLEHKDSMGNVAVIKKGDIQVMSAGTGIQHSEYNKNKDQQVKFLQIWLFPNQRSVQPRYDQISLNETDRKVLRDRRHFITVKIECCFHFVMHRLPGDNNFFSLFIVLTIRLFHHSLIFILYNSIMNKTPIRAL